ncbi:hypothetical protein C3E98_011705 [Pseudomonas sp. MWU13-2625]|nr:hypothetical protein C3E98_011705 [Pseudomonas sp. MWU13-2625]
MNVGVYAFRASFAISILIHASRLVQGLGLRWLYEVSENIQMSRLLWRGSLLPLGCVAAPIPVIAIFLKNRVRRFYDCFAAGREQAPSPQGARPSSSSKQPE